MEQEIREEYMRRFENQEFTNQKGYPIPEKFADFFASAYREKMGVKLKEIRKTPLEGLHQNDVIQNFGYNNAIEDILALLTSGGNEKE